MRKSTTGKVPPFVSCKRAAAELDLSVSGFLQWVKDGILPGPEPGSPPSSSRWRWSRIDRWLAGDRSDQPGRQDDLFPPELIEGHRKRGPKPGTGGRPRKTTSPSNGVGH